MSQATVLNPAMPPLTLRAGWPWSKHPPQPGELIWLDPFDVACIKQQLFIVVETRTRGLKDSMRLRGSYRDWHTGKRLLLDIWCHPFPRESTYRNITAELRFERAVRTIQRSWLTRRWARALLTFLPLPLELCELVAADVISGWPKRALPESKVATVRA